MKQSVITMKRGMVWEVLSTTFDGDVISAGLVEVGGFVSVATDTLGYKIVFRSVSGAGLSTISISLGRDSQIVLDFGEYGRVLFCEKDRPGYGEYDPEAGKIGCYLRHEPSGLERYVITKDWLINWRGYDKRARGA